MSTVGKSVTAMLTGVLFFRASLFWCGVVALLGITGSLSGPARWRFSSAGKRERWHLHSCPVPTLKLLASARAKPSPN